MRLITIIAVSLTLAVFSVGALLAESETSPKTEGLTNVTYSTSVVWNGGWYQCFNWTVIDNTSNASPLLDLNNNQFVVLVDKLSILNVASPDLFETPNSEWSFKDTSGFERYTADPSQKYVVPPSIGPGGSLSGFKLYYALPNSSASYTLPTTYAPITHVLAVTPIANPAGTQTYVSEDVTLPLLGSTGQFTGNTWFDKPNDGPRPASVPEASSMLLGLMGLVGPVGYAWRKRWA